MKKFTKLIGPMLVAIAAVLLLSAPEIAKAAATVGPSYGNIRLSPDHSFVNNQTVVYAAQKTNGKWYVVEQTNGSGIELGPYLSLSNPVVSPNSLKYAYAAVQESDGKVYLVIANVGGTNIVAYGPYDDITGNHFFNSNSNMVAFVAKESGVSKLRVIDLSSSSGAVIDSFSSSLILMAFSSSKIAYVTSNGFNKTVHRIDVITGPEFEYNFTNSMLDDLVAVSPDLNYYVYSDGHKIGLQNANSANQDIVYFANYAGVSKNTVFFHAATNLFAYLANVYSGGPKFLFVVNPLANNNITQIDGCPGSAKLLGFNNASGVKIACFRGPSMSAGELIFVKNMLSGEEKLYEFSYDPSSNDQIILNKDFTKTAYDYYDYNNPYEYKLVIEDLNKEYAAPRCGDNKIDSGEFCDGSNLNNQTCITKGFPYGTLSCSADCKSFVTSACVSNICGNGRIDSGEVCDAGDLNNQTCVTKGFASGTFRCSTDCKSFNTSGCVGNSTPQQVAPTCVDSDLGSNSKFIKGSISGNYMDGTSYIKYDECINSNQLKEWACGIMPIMFSQQKVVFTIPNSDGSVTTQDPGPVTPQVDNKSYFVANLIPCPNGCVDGVCKQQNSATTCGNGVINYGEVCDSNNLNNQTCQTKGYNSGVLRCASNCLSFDVSGCQRLDSFSTTNNNQQEQITNINKLTPAKIIKNADNTLTLRLNRLISALEQRVMDLETKLTAAINKVLTNRLKGQLLLQTDANGEVWYTSPDTGARFYVADGQAAYGILSGMGRGITSENLQKKISIGYDPNLYGGLLDTDKDGLPDVLEQAIGTDPNKADTDGDGYNDLAEVTGGYNPNGTGTMPTDKTFAKKLKGIYLDVDNRGAAWYINPKDFKRYYVSPETAYNVMKYLSLGVSNDNLRTIPVGQVSQ